MWNSNPPESLEQDLRLDLDDCQDYNDQGPITAVSLETGNLNHIVDEALLCLAPLAQEGVKIKCALSSDALTLQAGAQEIFWSIYYLILSALKNAHQPTHEVSRTRRLDIRSGWSPRKEGLIFCEVCSNGLPLPEDLRDPQGWSELFSHNRGEALGLLRAKELVEGRGGELQVESPRPELGHGIRFKIFLPSQW